MYKAFLFDFDGTLVDTDHLFLDSLNEVLTYSGIRPGTKQEYITFHGTNGIISDRLKGFREDVSRIIAEELQKELLKIYNHKIESGHLRFLPGAVDFLKALKREGLPAFIVTNKPHDMADKEISILNMRSLIAGHIGADNGYAQKPSPEMLIAAAEFLNVRKEECIMIGDHTNDLLAAVSAGMPSIILDRGRNLVHTESMSPDITVENLRELLSVTDINGLRPLVEKGMIQSSRKYSTPYIDLDFEFSL